MSKYVFLLFSLLVCTIQPTPRLVGTRPSQMTPEDVIRRIEQGTGNPSDSFGETTDLFQYLENKQKFVHLGKLCLLDSDFRAGLIERITKDGCAFCPFYAQQLIKGRPKPVGAIILGTNSPVVAQDLVFQAVFWKRNE